MDGGGERSVDHIEYNNGECGLSCRLHGEREHERGAADWLRVRERLGAYCDAGWRGRHDFAGEQGI